MICVSRVRSDNVEAAEIVDRPRDDAGSQKTVARGVQLAKVRLQVAGSYRKEVVGRGQNRRAGSAKEESVGIREPNPRSGRKGEQTRPKEGRGERRK
jgi:hypothetical protein